MLVLFRESASADLERVICSYELIEVVSILEDLVTESASDARGLMISSIVLLKGDTILEYLVTEIQLTFIILVVLFINRN